jgi:GH15 family glucan-1,4-alpha-glucosidase
MSETSIVRPATAAAPAEPPASVPIADYGLLADGNSAALVDRHGSIDWLCFPRYDSPAVLSRLLDPGARHWSIRQAGSFSTERRYLPGTLVIETVFTTDTGSVRVVDAMAFAPGQRGHELLMPILGFLPADDPRMHSTIEAIAAELTEDGLVLRYRTPARRAPS